jgi:hypothetical protein
MIADTRVGPIPARASQIAHADSILHQLVIAPTPITFAPMALGPMALTIPSSRRQSTPSTSLFSPIARSRPVTPPTTRHPRILARTLCPATPASQPQFTRTAMTATTPSTTPTTALALNTAATLPTDLYTRARSRAPATRTTRRRRIAASAADPAPSWAARATARRRGAATRDIRSRLQIPGVLTGSFTGRFVGCRTLYSGLVFVPRNRKGLVVE